MNGPHRHITPGAGPGYFTPGAGPGYATPRADSPHTHYTTQPDATYSRVPPREPEPSHIATSRNSARFDSMPPPSTIPQFSHPPATYRNVSRPLPDSFEVKADLPTPSRATPVKHAGFKPIANASSALKKFFPSEDDEMEPAPENRASTRSPSEPTSTKTPTYPDERTMVKQIRSSAVPESAPSPSHSLVPNLKPQPIPLANRAVGSPVAQDHDSTSIPPTPSVSSRSELYQIVSQVGEGTFGKVYKAQNTVTKVYVALKRIRMESEKDGFPVTAMREIKLLQSLRHPNVVRLYEMMVSNGLLFFKIVLSIF